ncbi:autophagy-related protein 22-like protein [Syncephalastrum racemosum]|uniref:Autophagy-related protein n=1 Tax=Syncephalastrum racemosum TaxID=13706 RepID=A0A1X2HGY9_SYNRA|nr:autophagy-related protein 22-like protein [Syncephalastrum racemosum]
MVGFWRANDPEDAIATTETSAIVPTTGTTRHEYDWDKINNYSYVPSMVQYLAVLNGWNPAATDPAHIGCSNNTPCDTRVGLATISVESVMLLNNGLNALIQAIILTTIGSLADCGNNGSHMLLVITLIACAAQMAFLAFDDSASSYWGVPLMVGLIFQVAYGASLVFYWALFPQLAVNEPEVRAARRARASDYDYIESITRNHISSISTAFSNIGFFLLSIILIGVTYALVNYYHMAWDDLPQYSLSIFSAVCGAYQLVFAVPWFVFQRHRPGPPLPSKANYWTYGWKKVGQALQEHRRLPQTFLFLLGYFVLSTSVSSTNSVTTVLINAMTNFNGPLQTYMNLVNAACSIIGCLGFLGIQKWFRLSTKTMLQWSTGLTLAIPLWGCVGLITNKFGFRTVAEWWVYQAWFGLFCAPFYAYSQTMMSELIPGGKQNMFFALFGITSKIAQFVGPAVIGGITQAAQNTRTGFIVCAVCQALPLALVALVDMDKAETRIKIYEEQERRKSSSTATTTTSLLETSSIISENAILDSPLK